MHLNNLLCLIFLTSAIRITYISLMNYVKKKYLLLPSLSKCNVSVLWIPSIKSTDLTN